MCWQRGMQGRLRNSSSLSLAPHAACPPSCCLACAGSYLDPDPGVRSSAPNAAAAAAALSADTAGPAAAAAAPSPLLPRRIIEAHVAIGAFLAAEEHLQDMEASSADEQPWHVSRRSMGTTLHKVCLLHVHACCELHVASPCCAQARQIHRSSVRMHHAGKRQRMQGCTNSKSRGLGCAHAHTLVPT